MCQNQTNQFIQALKDGVVPATGCTEPIAVAFGAATCMAQLTNRDIQSIEVRVSPNVMKNALAVMVPGTGEPGLLVAAAAGAIAGDAAAGLSVIEGLRATDLPTIIALAHSGKVTAKTALVPDDLYVEVTIKDLENTATVAIAGSHTNIFSLKKDNQILIDHPRPAAHASSESKQFLQTMNFKAVWDFAMHEPLAHIRFMKEAHNLNLALAQDGFTHDYGLQLGQSINGAKRNHFGSGTENDLGNRMIAYAAAASDARMGGAQLPAMSNSGSGNQGITATIPVSVAADAVQATEEQLIRAQTLSHLTALYIHSFLPVLSAFCATDSAAMGAAAGVVYLYDGTYEDACHAIQNMAGDAAGMICDGAGCACAMKVATAVSSMYRGVNLALQGIVIPNSNGLVCPTIDETIHGIGRLGTEALRETDSVILDIMLNK